MLVCVQNKLTFNKEQVIQIANKKNKSSKLQLRATPEARDYI